MSRSNKQVLQEANPSKVDATFNRVGLGDAFGLIPKTYRGTVASHILVLPTGAKAVGVIAAFATAATTAGAKDPTVGTPSAGEVAVNAAGDILFNATDVVTAAEVTYVTPEGDVVSASLAVLADGTSQLPGTRSAVLIVSASLDDDASSAGAKTVVARSASAPSAGEVNLSLTGQITFASADVGASPVTATVTYLEYPDETVGEALVADSNQ